MSGSFLMLMGFFGKFTLKIKRTARLDSSPRRSAFIVILHVVNPTISVSHITIALYYERENFSIGKFSQSFYRNLFSSEISCLNYCIYVIICQSIFYKIFMVFSPSIFWKRQITPNDLRCSFVSMLLITH